MFRLPKYLEILAAFTMCHRMPKAQNNGSKVGFKHQLHKEGKNMPNYHITCTKGRWNIKTSRERGWF
jgi:hypothetical protein